MLSPLKVLPQLFNQVVVSTFTKALQHLHSFLFQPCSYRSAGVLQIIDLLRDPSFSRWTDDLTFDSRILRYTVFTNGSVAAADAGLAAAKTSPNHHPSNTMLDRWYMMCLYALFGFHQAWCCAFWSNITFVSSVQRSLFQKSFGMFRCSF